jgi:hypothetical protein
MGSIPRWFERNLIADAWEDIFMPKPIRAALACCALLLATSLTMSTAAPARAAGNPAFVMFTLAPQKIVCLGEKAPVIIKYSWDDSSGLAPLAPLYPLKPKRGAQTDTPPGKLTLRGDLAGQLVSMSVGYGGQLNTEYKAKAAGKEILTTTLTYSSYANKDTRPFEVKNCNYNLVIKAWNEQKQSGTVATGFFSAEGKISIGEDGSVSGELREDAWFDVSSDNPVLACELVPLPMAQGKLTVSGTKSTSASGEETIHLTLSYGEVSGFPGSVELACKDKVKGKDIPPTPYNLPPSANPGDYLLSALDFNNGGALTGSYGKGGHADYILEKLK